MEDVKTMQQETEPLWRMWVDDDRRIVSFHEEEGFFLAEFHSHEMFLRYLNRYSIEHYRYQ